ncbi:glycosyltransferase family 2 protein [Methylibium sp.]|uniref:glycosyltransferase family 2 protein n=1 Tax=Methylibium sp. TaxID=2067992 RepID=UPI003D0FB6D4
MSQRVSLVLLAYNQQSVVHLAAQSCLAQECEPLEIVLSDDGSSDDTLAVLQAVAAAYRGAHQVRVRRNSVNVGIGEHYNQVVRDTTGDLIVTAAGDDISEPTRVQQLLAAWERTHCRADLIASHVTDMDHDGALHKTLHVDDLAAWTSVSQWAAHRPYVIGASHAFTRRLMGRFGPLNPRVFYEDQIMAFRAIALGGAVTVDAPLVRYRRGGTSAMDAWSTAERFVRWTRRQNDRLLAEMEQLLHDAALVGCYEDVLGSLVRPLARERYLRSLLDAADNSQRWRLFRSATEIPFWWRLRKCLHHCHPNTVVALKRAQGKR